MYFKLTSFFIKYIAKNSEILIYENTDNIHSNIYIAFALSINIPYFVILLNKYIDKFSFDSKTNENDNNKHTILINK